MDSQFEVEERSRRLGEVLAHLDRILDWELLGTLYCSEGGEEFFCAEQRQALAEGGMVFAQELAERLPAGRDSTPSLYLGAAVFELFPALFEHLVLGRGVVLLNLEQAETRELNRGLNEASRELGMKLPVIQVVELGSLRGTCFGHLWMTSVLNDPEAFPALHDLLYERSGGEYSTGGGDLVEERRVAEALLLDLFALADEECWLTTTDEELPLIVEACEQNQLALTVPEQARLSGIVGDPVRHCRLRRR